MRSPMTQEERYIKMTETPISRLIPSLAIPTIISMLVTSIYNMADTFFVSRISTSASAAVGVSYSLMAMIQALGFTLGMGSGNYLSRVLGSRDEEKAERIASTGFYTAIFVGLVFAAICLPNLDLLVRLLGATDTIAPYAKDYAKYILMAAPVMTGALSMNNLLRFQGLAVYSMIGITTGGILNMILDPIFIFVFDMDIAGAAVATVIAQLSSCIFVLLTLHSKKMQIPIHLVKPEWEIGKRICKIGFSPFLILATDSVIIIALNAVLQYYGGESQGDTLITAATIVQSYMLLITSPMLGITGGSQPLISFNYGANKPDRIRKTVKWVLVLCITFTTVMFLVSRILPQYFVQIFTDNARYRELSIWGIQVFTLMVIPLSLQYVFVDALTALGMTRLSLSLSLFRKIVYFVMTCVLPIVFAAKSAFYAEPFADGAAACLTSLVFFVIYRKYLKGEGRLGEIRL